MYYCRECKYYENACSLSKAIECGTHNHMLWESKEVKPMIKVKRKPVDKQELTRQSIIRFLERDKRLNRNTDGEMDVDVRVINEIEKIYSSENQGEIESVEIGVPCGYVNTFESRDNYTVKLTLEQCKEIAKAIQ